MHGIGGRALADGAGPGWGATWDTYWQEIVRWNRTYYFV
ncbi:hypothetical protein Psta_1100 [Pirellula staleyi DSM 6068]|uniref:Uncharacterized protein n=1 Tax=Pirellula staleyi (strain ATCC 27377 / DSM 6068 / ICPB 4128) TaxID=530564 RepID=D2R8G6_PIRSD|nr:hypothetical protein Psta_1100 [Pirellula staleyi DSM 6068]